MLVALKWHRQAMAARTARGSPWSTNTTAPRVCRLPRYGWVLVMPTLNPHVLQIPQPLPSRFRPCSDPNDDAAPADWQWRFAILPLSTHSWRNDTPCRSNPVEITHQDCYSEEEWDGICTFVNITYTCAGAGFVLKIQFVYPFVAEIVY